VGDLDRGGSETCQRLEPDGELGALHRVLAEGDRLLVGAPGGVEVAAAFEQFGVSGVERLVGVESRVREQRSQQLEPDDRYPGRRSRGPRDVRPSRCCRRSRGPGAAAKAEAIVRSKGPCPDESVRTRQCGQRLC
jgi:hypothetical protein